MQQAIYSVALTVTTDHHLTDDQARDIAAAWAPNAALDLAMTSTSRDEPWIRVTGIFTHTDARPAPLADRLRVAVEQLDAALAAAGARVTTWHAAEIISADEQRARNARATTVPPLVKTAQLAQLAGVTPQRISQLEAERAAGKRSDFPAPVVDGWWLRSAGEHWARTRKTTPGPTPRKADEA